MSVKKYLCGSPVLLAGMGVTILSSRALGTVVFDDQFGGTANSAPDTSKWTTTPNPTTGDSTHAKVIQTGSGDLAINGVSSGHAGFAQTISTFSPNSTATIQIDNNAGYNPGASQFTRGVELGYLNDQRFNSGTFSGITLYGETVSQSDIKFHVNTNGNQNVDLFSIDSGFPIETNQTILIDWIDSSTVRFAVDNGRDGTYEFDHTYSGAAGQLTGSQALELQQAGGQPQFNFVVDRATVDTTAIPEPTTLTLIACGGAILLRRRRIA